MATLTWSTPLIRRHPIIKDQLRDLGLKKVTCPPHRTTPLSNRRKTLPLLCTKSVPWEASPPYSPSDEDNIIIKGSDIVDPIHAEDAPELSSFQEAKNVIEMKNEPPLHPQLLKWPMWLLGPSVLLATGMVPTLWLPLSSVFLGANIASLLSLVGLDCIFNMGATLFLLMADSCAQPSGERSSLAPRIQAPLTYRLWNLGSSLVGFVVPLMMLYFSYRGALQPHIPFISFSVLLGPYLLLLSVQVLTEMLTWHWKSPVWLLTPVVYETYRVLQLMRGLRLGDEIGAPGWALESIRVLVSWWVLVLGIQLMRIAWLAGLDHRAKQQP